MHDNNEKPKVPTNFERGSNIPTQNKVPPMPNVKPPAKSKNFENKKKCRDYTPKLIMKSL